MLTSVSLATAKAQLSDLVRRGQAGEAIQITVRGKPAVRLVAVEAPKKPIDVEALRRFSATMPYQKEPAVDLIRNMRDEKF